MPQAIKNTFQHFFHYKALIFEEAVCALVCVRVRDVCVRVRAGACAGVCMCIRVSEAEVAWLFHQTLVHKPVWECAGVRSCANRRMLLCREPPDTHIPPKGVAGWRSLSVSRHAILACSPSLTSFLHGNADTCVRVHLCKLHINNHTHT